MSNWRSHAGIWQALLLEWILKTNSIYCTRLREMTNHKPLLSDLRSSRVPPVSSHNIHPQHFLKKGQLAFSFQGTLNFFCAKTKEAKAQVSLVCLISDFFLISDLCNPNIFMEKINEIRSIYSIKSTTMCKTIKCHQMLVYDFRTRQPFSKSIKKIHFWMVGVCLILRPHLRVPQKSYSLECF